MSEKKPDTKQSTFQGSVVSVDFGQTSNTGLIEKGVYQVKVVSAEAKNSNSTGQPMVTFTLEILDGEFANRRVYLNNSLQPHALFGFRKTLEALGVKVPTSAMQIDLKKLAGAQMNAEIGHDDYNGQLKAKVIDVAPIHYDETPEDESPKQKPRDKSDPELDL